MWGSASARNENESHYRPPPGRVITQAELDVNIFFCDILPENKCKYFLPPGGKSEIIATSLRESTMITILLILATITVTGIVGGFLVADFFYFQELAERAENQEGENGNNAQN